MKEKKYTYTEFLDTFFPLLKNDIEQMKKFGYPEFIPWSERINEQDIKDIQQWLIFLSNTIAYDMRRKLYTCLEELINLRNKGKHFTKIDEIMVTLINCDEEMAMIQIGTLYRGFPTLLSKPTVLHKNDTLRISNIEMNTIEESNGTKKNS
jgi:hypothetical protein